MGKKEDIQELKDNIRLLLDANDKLHNLFKMSQRKIVILEDKVEKLTNKEEPMKIGKLDLVNLNLIAHQTKSDGYYEYKLRLGYRLKGAFPVITFGKFEDILKEKLKVIEFN